MTSDECKEFCEGSEDSGPKTAVSKDRWQRTRTAASEDRKQRTGGHS